MILPQIPGHRKRISGEQHDMMQLDFQHRQQRIYRNRTIMVATKKISGNMILLLIPGRRKPISGEQHDTDAVGFRIGSKGYIGTGYNGNGLLQKISGNMILPPIPGHRKRISGELHDTMQLDFPSAAKDILEPAMMVATYKRFLGI